MSRFVIPVVFALFVGFVLYTTMTGNEARCEVCVEVDGQQACRTASGADSEQAIRTATENACAQLVSGMSATRRCMAQPPASVSCD